MTQAEKSGVDGLRDTIRKLADRPEGMCTADVSEWSKTRTGQQCGKLVDAGEIFRGRRSQHDVRFFATLKAATAYVKAGTRDAPVTIKAKRADGPVTYAPGFKFTRCPSPAEFGAAAKLARAVTPDAGCKQ